MKKDRRVERSNKALKKAMIDLLKEKNYEEITIKNIVEKAEYSAPTFYKYYKTKDEIMFSIVRDELNSISDMFYDTQITIDNIKYIDLRQLIEKIFNRVYELREFYTVVLTQQSLFRYAEFFTYEWYIFGINKLDIVGEENFTEFERYLKCSALFNAIKYWYINDFSYSPGCFAKMYYEVVFNQDRIINIKDM